jgi:ATPase subunit of ABC transporter with duplicated ATPase domains
LATWRETLPSCEKLDSLVSKIIFIEEVFMPKKAKSKSKAKKPASRKLVRKKASKKKTLKKKVTKKKTIRKKAAKKKALKKKAARKKSAKKAARKTKPVLPQKSVMVEPGPPSGAVPPVEEPAANEEALGTVTHYYSHLGVVVIQLNKGTLKIGDTIHVKGHSTDFTQKVESMEYEHQHVDQAGAGQSVGLKVVDQAREHDIVYLVK